MIVVCFCFTARNAAQARRLEIDGHRELWFRHGIRADTAVPGQRSINEPDGERRKLDCMAAVHRREGKEDAKAAKVTVRSNFALSQWGDKVAALSVKQSHSSLSLCVSSSLKSQTKTEQEQLSGSETCHEGALVDVWSISQTAYRCYNSHGDVPFSPLCFSDCTGRC